MKLCTHCQCQMEDDLLLCPSCGRDASLPVEPSKGKQSKKKWIVLTAILLLFAMVGGVAFFSLRDSSDELLWCSAYTDGDKVYVRASSMTSPILLDHKLYGMSEFSNMAQLQLCITADGKQLLFIEQDDSCNEFSLYSLSLTEPSSKSVLIGAEVHKAYVAKDSDTVYYNDMENRLYRYSISGQESLLIAENAAYFRAVNDGELLIYRVSSDSADVMAKDSYYLLHSGEKKGELIDCDEAFFTSTDYDFVYRKDGQQYLMDEEGRVWELPSVEELSLDRSSEIKHCGDGNFYLTKETLCDVSELFENDLEDSSRAYELLGQMESVSSKWVYYWSKDDLKQLCRADGTLCFADDGSAVAFATNDCQTHKLKLSLLEETMTKENLSLSKAVAKLLANHSCIRIIKGEELWDFSCSGRVGISRDGSIVFLYQQNGRLYVSPYEAGAYREPMLLGEVDCYSLQENHLLYVMDGDLYRYGQKEPLWEDVPGYETMNRGELVTEYDTFFISNGDAFGADPVTGELYYSVDSKLWKIAGGEPVLVSDDVSAWHFDDCDALWVLTSHGKVLVSTSGMFSTVGDGAEQVAFIPVGGYLLPLH